MSEILFHAFTHADLIDGVQTLAVALEAERWRPDLLVGIGRGGLSPAVYLSHRLDLPMVSVDFSSTLAAFGTDLLVTLAARAREGSRLLLVEDINDSGRTIAAIREQMAAQGAPAGSVRVAVLIDNLRSGQPVDYRFRTIDRETDKAWYVFPWESVAPREQQIAEASEVPSRIA